MNTFKTTKLMTGLLVAFAMNQVVVADSAPQGKKLNPSLMGYAILKSCKTKTERDGLMQFMQKPDNQKLVEKLIDALNAGNNTLNSQEINALLTFLATPSGKRALEEIAKNIPSDLKIKFSVFFAA